MEYRSPLGANFKLQKSLAALESKEEKETPRKPAIDFIPFQSGNSSTKHNDQPHWLNPKNHRFDNSPGHNDRRSNNWNSPNPGNNQRNNAAPISQYYHPSMVEDPWKDLIAKS